VSILSQILFAQQAGEGGTQSLVGGFAPFIIIIGIFYFLLIRPQQKQAKDHKNMLGALKKGDEVVTNGGIIGRIYAVTDKVLTIEVAKDVRLRVQKSAVQGRFSENPADDAADAKEKEKKEEGR
jgi:preprotein translocase subunit YajC